MTGNGGNLGGDGLMGETAIDLRPFCSKDADRPYLHQPFSRGDWTYATDGRVMVRVPRRADVSEIERSPNAGLVIDKLPVPTETKPLPLFVFPKAETTDCLKCAGRGTEHDCPDCMCECEHCDSGTVTEVISGAIGDALFGAQFLTLLASLPGIRVPTAPEPLKPMRFLFDGGEGILMPMTRPGEKHVPEPQP